MSASQPEKSKYIGGILPTYQLDALVNVYGNHPLKKSNSQIINLLLYI